MKENEFIRTFDNSDFGYRRITVERPLRLNFAVTDERILQVKEGSKFSELASSKKRKDAQEIAEEEAAGRKRQDEIISVLESLRVLGTVKNRESFSKALNNALKAKNCALPAPLLKEILDALSERDEAADICTDGKGNQEPDPELRDYENVPLKEDVAEYMKREVLPHVPNAWVDESKTRIGYEINFNRYFYKYVPPRPLEEIEADLRKIEAEINQLLNEGKP